ncbi:hypothetical protein LEN26_001750 [Aphanomyces euteiches]|nr:hypothetical protein AeMF1_001865 [Aphanomyces euteiches]KAH9160669.1 hypothetical protein LEN26_001750 [Aphanomyces euteiches]KAH9191039.1 hypothetical protein AeNC1_006982 [Aphanomyces euteiches]
MNCEGRWDIELDLSFLLPCDADSNDLAMTEACNVISTAGEPSMEDVKPQKRKRNKSSAPRGRKPYEAHRRQEIFDLQHQVWILENQLAQTKANALCHKNMTQWERLARTQLIQMHKVCLENQSLRHAVDLNRSFISKTTAQLSKRPNNSLATDWSLYKLGAPLTSRHAAIHAIADREYDIKDTAFINAGMFDDTKNIFRLRGEVSSVGSVKCTITAHANIPAPCAVVSQALWEVYNGKNVNYKSTGTRVIHERLDANTVYERLSHSFRGITVNANSVRKLYKFDHEHVIVVRSVLEDALATELPNGYVEVQSSWMSIVPLGDNECQLSLLRKLSFESNPSNAKKKAAPCPPPRNVHVDEVITEGGLFASSQPLDSILQGYPGSESYLNRSEDIKTAMRETVGAALLKFHQNQSRVTNVQVS